MSGAGANSCVECGSPLAGDQRYCLVCGARAGSRSPQLERLMRNAVAQPSGGGPPLADAGASSPDAIAATAAAAAIAGASRASGLRLPPPRISALLVLVFLAFGVLLGNVAGSRVDSTLAADAGSRLRLVLPPTRSATPTTPGSTSTPGSPSSEAPSSEPESTPAPAASTATTSTAAKSTAPAEEGGSGSSEGGSSTEAVAAAPATKLPPIKHVFLITLSNEPYATAFGPASTARYLSQTLEKRGELLVHYDAVAHEELANGVALLSGQGPTAETAANCPTYSDIAPATIASSEQVTGSGCVYPASTRTLPGQLSARHLGWRAYVEGIDEAGAQPGACAHPVLGAPDPTAAQAASTGPYATFRNPLVYFHSITDTPACAADDVGLARLTGDLTSTARTPSFAYIVPDRCHDGNPTPCTPGAPAGMGPADAFMLKVVPEILASKAYHEGGLIVITVDEAPSGGEYGDSSSCCGQPSFPNLAAASTGGRVRGGGAVGALLLSRYVKGATTNQEAFNHFSLLRTIEDLFSLKHLGYAGLPAVKPFEPSMFTAKPSG